VITGVALGGDAQRPRPIVRKLSNVLFRLVQAIEDFARRSEQPLPPGVSTIRLPTRRNSAVPSLDSTSRS